MKSTITVSIDLDDLYGEEYHGEESSGASVSELVRDAIKLEVRCHIGRIIGKTVQDEVEKQVSQVLKSIADGEVKKMIEFKVIESMNSLEVTDSYSGNKKLSIAEWVNEKVSSYTDRNFHEKTLKKIEEHTKVAVNTLQDQYNLQFASSLISKMKDADLLSQKGIKALLSSK